MRHSTLWNAKTLFWVSDEFMHTSTNLRVILMHQCNTIVVWYFVKGGNVLKNYRQQVIVKQSLTAIATVEVCHSGSTLSVYMTEFCCTTQMCILRSTYRIKQWRLRCIYCVFPGQRTPLMRKHGNLQSPLSSRRHHAMTGCSAPAAASHDHSLAALAAIDRLIVTSDY